MYELMSPGATLSPFGQRVDELFTPLGHWSTGLSAGLRFAAEGGDGAGGGGGGDAGGSAGGDGGTGDGVGSGEGAGAGSAGRVVTDPGGIRVITDDADGDKPPAPPTRAAPVKPPAKAAGAGGGTEGGDSTAGDDWKVDDLPEGARKMIADLRKEAGDHRAAAKKAKDAAKASDEKFAGAVEAFMKGLGLTPEEPEQVTPEQLTRQLSEVGEQHRQATVELAVWKLGHELDANVAELLDSRTFVTDLHKLDPSGEGFADQLRELVGATVERNPKFKRAVPAQQPVAPSGGSFSGGPGGRTDVDSMSIEDHFRQINNVSPRLR